MINNIVTWNNSVLLFIDVITTELDYCNVIYSGMLVAIIIIKAN